MIRAESRVQTAEEGVWEESEGLERGRRKRRRRARESGTGGYQQQTAVALADGRSGVSGRGTFHALGWALRGRGKGKEEGAPRVLVHSKNSPRNFLRKNETSGGARIDGARGCESGRRRCSRRRADKFRHLPPPPARLADPHFLFRPIPLRFPPSSPPSPFPIIFRPPPGC